MKQQQALSLLLDLCRSVHALNLARSGAPALLVLYVLDKARTAGEDPVPAGTISEQLRSHPSTLTPVLRRLLDDGLISRDVHAIDSRLAAIAITDEGRAELARGAPVLDALADIGRRAPGVFEDIAHGVDMLATALCDVDDAEVQS